MEVFLTDPVVESIAAQSLATFAVIDGGHIQNLQRKLMNQGLLFTPLYLDEVDKPALASGPHLVQAVSAKAVERIRDLVDGLPACVWWIWPAGDEAKALLYNHLRTINMVEIPSGSGAFYEAAIFRHADPRVLKQLLPLFSPEQSGRFFGQADSVILEQTGDHQIAVHRRHEERRRQKGLLRITPAQVETLSDEAFQKFLDHLEKHLNKMFAPTAAALSPRLRQAAQAASIRAEDYGLTKIFQMTLFVDLIVMLGIHFDTDPTLGWARDQCESGGGADSRDAFIDALWYRGEDYFDVVLEGAEPVVSVPAYRRYLDIGTGATQRRSIDELRHLWPEKCAEAGERGMSALIRNSETLARSYGLSTTEDICEVVRLAFLLGHRFDVDPFHPWAAAILENRHGERRGAALREAAIEAVIEPWLAHDNAEETA